MNRKTWAGLILLVALASGIYCYLNFREVNVIDVHQITILHQLSSITCLTLTIKIRWWLIHQPQITSKYNIKAFNDNGPITYYFYALGEGYQSLEKDRICFKQMQPLLIVWIKFTDENSAEAGWWRDILTGFRRLHSE